MNKINKWVAKLNYLQHVNGYIALQYCLMIGNAFAWKAVTDSALTAELEGHSKGE